MDHEARKAEACRLTKYLDFEPSSAASDAAFEE